MKRTIMIVALLLGSAVHAQTCKDVWNDVQKPWRPDAEMDYDVQVDGAACDRQVGDQRTGSAGRSLSGARHSSVLRGHDLLNWCLCPAEQDGTLAPNVAL